MGFGRFVFGAYNDNSYLSFIWWFVVTQTIGGAWASAIKPQTSTVFFLLLFLLTLARDCFTESVVLLPTLELNPNKVSELLTCNAFSNNFSVWFLCVNPWVMVFNFYFCFSESTFESEELIFGDIKIHLRTISLNIGVRKSCRIY